MFDFLITRTLFVNISFLFSFFSTETSQNKIHVKKIYFGCVTWFLVVCYMGGIYHNRPDIDLLDPWIRPIFWRIRVLSSHPGVALAEGFAPLHKETLTL